MSINTHKFIVDTQLPPKLAKALTTMGYQTVHTTYYPEGQHLKDYRIREIASKENRIVVTKDTDFFDYYMLKGVPPKVLLLELGNIENKALLLFFEKNINTIISLFDNNGLVVCSYDKIISF